ncbi:MAG TPA: TonB-dependent siderophore receptor [Opitutaceae bacterium]
MKPASSSLAPNSKSVAALTAMVMASGASATAQTAAATSTKDDVTQLPQVNVQAAQNRSVSSPKFTAPLVDTPQTVSVIPKEVFNQQGAASLADALGNTPGITFLAGEGGHVSGSNSFVMRGFDMSGNIFIDGVRDNGNYGRDIFNLEQIEVVKGPSGDNGRGSASGYINLATKVPQAVNFGAVTASYGFDEYASIDRKRTTLDLNQSVSDGAAVRVNALWQDGGVAGRDYAEKNSWGIAPSLALGLGQPTRAYLNYQHNEQNDRPDYGALGANLSGTATAVRPSGGTADRSRFYGLTSDFDDVKIDVVSARLEHDLTPTARLSNHTRWSNTDRNAIYTVPSNVDVRPDMNTGQVIEMVTTSRQAFAREIETISNQTNLASQFSTGGLDHSFAGGLELIRENGRTLRDWTGLGTTGELTKTVNVTAAGAPTTPTVVTGTDVYNPIPSRGVTGFAPTYASIDDIRIDTAALYAYDTLRLSERWQASGGARLERYSARYDVRTVATGAVAPFEVEDTILTGKLGVVYKPAREGSLYASWGLAAQPPGTNNLSNDNGSRSNGTPGTTGQNSPNADPVESYNYEVGVKWDFFQRKLTTSLSLFRSERTNIVVASDTNGIPTTFGDQTVEGVEFGVSGRITNNWIVFGGFNLLESENRNSTSTTQNGSELNWTPEFSGNLWTTYRFPFGLTIGGGLQHTGEANVSLNNTSAARLPAYTVVNAMIGYEVMKNLNLRLNVGNVSDKLYARAINNNSNRAYYGDPRTFLLSADYRF